MPEDFASPAVPAQAIPPELPATTARRHAAARTIFALMLREMATRYGRSPGGYLWAVLEPLGALTLMALGFSLLLRSPALGDSFILFYATGFLPFQLYQTLSISISRSIGFSKPLLAYPAVTWLDALLARFILNSLTGVAVAFLILAGILALIETRTVIELNPIVEAMLLSALLGLGIGTLNCLIIGKFPVWDQVWSIATRPLFLASGVIFLYEDLPRSVQSILWWNPLIHITGLMRTGFYPMYSADFVSPELVLAAALVPLGLGLLLLRRYHRDIINN